MNVARVAVALAVLCTLTFGDSALAQEVTRYVRYSHNDAVAYGILEGKQVRELDGAPWNVGASRRMIRSRRLGRQLSPV